MTGLSDQSLAAFVEAIAADRPAPGCGAAAAVSLAMAAACAAKAFAISARHVGGDPELAAAAERAGRISRAALDEADRDAADFAALLHAGPGDPAPERALKADGEDLLALAATLGDLVRRHEARIDPRMRGDALAALAMAATAETIERHNLAELAGD